jgi:hypothetical protein
MTQTLLDAISTVRQWQVNHLESYDLEGELMDVDAVMKAQNTIIAVVSDFVTIADEIKNYRDFVDSGQPADSTIEGDLHYRLQAAIAAAHSES